jgi:hypothetical protein
MPRAAAEKPNDKNRPSLVARVTIFAPRMGKRTDHGARACAPTDVNSVVRAHLVERVVERLVERLVVRAAASIRAGRERGHERR